MLSWLFPPSCPCEPEAKGWVEERLEWLAEEFDDSAFNGRRLVLPTADFFPAPYDGSEEAVRVLFDQVCEYMDVIPDLVDLKLVTNTSQLWIVNGSGQALPPAAGGTYQERFGRFLIHLDTSEMHDPVGMVGVMAHELAHARLLGEGRIMSEIFDNELLTDLTVVHFGLGIFLANSPRNWAGQTSLWPGTKVKRTEYMSPPMFGWALAHLAWFRGEERPAWGAHLHPAARANLKEGVRYLFATSDSAYKPVRLRKRPRR